jgi:hypothetical protein
MTSAELLGATIEAHGGRERWRRIRAITGTLSSGGLAFQSRCQPSALKNLKIEVRPHDPAVTLGDFVRPGWRGTWTPRLVTLRDDRGQIVEQRLDPRRHFARPVARVYWDKLDILTFAGYALWNYLSFPFLLEREGVALLNAVPRSVGANLRLDVQFETPILTHSERQSFYVDPAGGLVRHDYAAEPIGRWATGANFCLASAAVDGLLFYTRRKVFPRIAPLDAVLPFPTLVWIEIDDLGVTFAGSSA